MTLNQSDGEKRIDELVKNAKDGIDVKDDLMAILENVDLQLEQLTETISYYEDMIESMKEGSAPGSDDELKDIQKKRSDQIELRNKYYSIRDKIWDGLAQYKNFDKSIFFDNLKYLLEKNDSIKIGQIERAAKLRLGYKARLEKKDNKTDPSIEFILTAARMLGVTVDMLISERLGDITPTEEYIKDFLGNLCDDTRDGEILWNRESVQRMNTPCNEGEYGEDHVLFLGDPTVPFYFGKFVSRFYPEKNAYVHSDSYNATIPGTVDKLYLVPCTIKDKDKEESGIKCCEGYIVSSNGQTNDVQPLFSTMNSCAEVGEAVRRLYLQIKQSLNHVQVDKRTRVTIDKYMKSRRETKESSV